MNGLWCGFRQPALLRKNDGRSYVIQWDLSDRYESEMNEKIRPTSDIKDWSSWVPREVLPCAILIIVLPYLVVGPVDMFQPFMNVWTFEVFRWLFVKWLELITYLLYLKKTLSLLKAFSRIYVYSNAILNSKLWWNFWNILQLYVISLYTLFNTHALSRMINLLKCIWGIWNMY